MRKNMKNDENYEGLYNYQPLEIPKEHKQVVLEVLKHFEAKPAKGEIVVCVGGKSLK